MKAPGLSFGEEPLQPVARLYDGRLDMPGRIVGLSGQALTFDLNLLKGGDGEITDLSAFTPDVGTLSRITSNVWQGTGSLQLAHTATAQAVAVVRMMPGEPLVIRGAARRTTGNVAADISVRNRKTGRYLTTGGAWASGALQTIVSSTGDSSPRSAAARPRGWGSARPSRASRPAAARGSSTSRSASARSPGRDP